MKFITLALSILMLSGCATIVKSERQTVRLTGGLEQGETKIRLPDGVSTLTDGSGAVIVTRSKEDIPIEVTCNGVTQKGVLPTHYDWGWAGLGNFVFGGIPGWVIDGVGNKGYDAKSPYSVHELCSSPRQPAAQIPMP